MAYSSNITSGTGIQGMDTVLANLNRDINKMKNGSLKGLIEAAIIVRDDMERTPPLIPLDLENLRASWFIVTAKRRQTQIPAFIGPDASKMGSEHVKTMAEAQAMCAAVNKPVLIMGFTANYALWVHEMLGNINWSRPNSGPEFFLKSLERNKQKILAVIKKNVQIP